MKWLIIIALLIAAWWYFQPESFNQTYNNIKNALPGNKQTTTTGTIPPTTTTENRTVLAARTAPAFDGFCIIGDRCEFVSKEQCPDLLYTNRTQCEIDLGIADSTENGYTYYGRPVTANGNPYDCKTDTDCRFDLPACRDIFCQCEYSTGRCYT